MSAKTLPPNLAPHSGRRSSESRSLQERYIIRVQKGSHGFAQTFDWNGDIPLVIGHSKKLVVEKTAKSIRIRDLSGELHKIHRKSSIEVSFNEMKKKTSLSIGEFKVSLSFAQVLEPIHLLSPSVTGKNREIRVYSRRGPVVLSSEAIGKQFVARQNGLKIFSLRKRGDHFEIKSFVGQLEMNGSHSAQLDKKETLSLDSKTLQGISIQHHSNFWNFSEIAIPGWKGQKKTDLDQETTWFQKALKTGSFAFGAFLLLVLLWPKPEVPEEEKELIPPQYAKVVMTRAKTPEPVAQGSARPSGGKAAQKKVQKTAVVQAFRDKALRSAVSGLLKGGMTNLLKQSQLTTGLQSKSAASRVFDTVKKGGVGTAPIIGLGKARNVKVASLGGSTGKGKGGKGVGYGSGKKAGVSGQGSGFVSLDTKGSAVEEGLTKDQVGKVIHSHMSEVRYCYESAMLRNPDVEGKLLIDFMISGAGRVKTSSVRNSSVSEGRLADCILRRLATWKFPKPKGGVTVSVSYPFIFKSLGR